MMNRGARIEQRQARPQEPVWPTLRRIFALHRAHWLSVLGLLVVVIVNSIVGVGPSLVLQHIVDDALPGSGHNGGDAGLLNVLIIIFVALIGIGALSGVLQTFLSNIIGQSVMYDLRARLYRHLTHMSLRWFTANRTGEVLSRVSNDVSAVQGVVTDSFSGIIGNLITVGSTFVVMLMLDWRLACFSVVFLPFFLIPARRVGNAQRELFMRTQEEVATLNAQMQETLSVSGALLVKTFGREHQEISRFEETAASVRNLSIRRAMVGRWFMFSMGLFSALAPAVVYWYGGHRVIDDAATLGTVVASASLLTRLYGPASQLLNLNVTVLSSLALFERIFDYLDLEHEIADRPGAIALDDVKGAVSFEDVSFSYHRDGQRLALEHVSFDVPAGQFAALVGHSGAGKTTCAYLVPRLYDVTGGRITVDGHDLRDIQLESLTAAIGMVNQEPFLFHDTVRMNLRYARPDATDEELEAAARAANIHEVIAALPFGYDTIVGERGYRLSGGEKQRVAIARAILKDPSILVLDEATSSVDTHTERQIQDALERLTKGRTVIAIAHRLSTILNADLIVVLDHGRVVEQGRHAELLARDGVYASLYRQQFADEGDARPAPLDDEAAAAAV
ncbi:MAG TPA: ABC transporter ATP-binding protein [Tepidiformaceae bacterium]|nr:ABC transporter ATP-binding protein [Tepidiformaceae bacterium]